MEQLRRQGQDVPRIMAEVMEGATINAVQKATDKTPPSGAPLSGTGTREGGLAQHWAVDSRTRPAVIGGTLKTTLANDLQYASYVSDGHNMNEHFVPGLEPNPDTGMLEKTGKRGIVVGKKTSFVKGRYMKEAGIGAYRDTINKELAKRVREGFR